MSGFGSDSAFGKAFRREYGPMPRKVAFDGLHRTIVDGKPFFPLGIYHVDPEDFETIRDIGFNFVQTFKYKMILGKGNNLCHGYKFL